MPLIDTLEGPLWRRRTPMKQWLIWAAWLIALSIAVYAWNLISEKTIWMFVWDAPRQMADIGGRMLPPDWDYLAKLWRPVWDTLNIATIGTAIAMILACIDMSSRRKPRG